MIIIKLSHSEKMALVEAKKLWHGRSDRELIVLILLDWLAKNQVITDQLKISHNQVSVLLRIRSDIQGLQEIIDQDAERNEAGDEEAE